MRQRMFNYIKNLPGWRTKQKLVVFVVDDYGNVRLDSRQARENLDRAGLKVHSRFDAFDALETREDLEMLYEVLHTVKDRNGRPAVFTPFALPCNINYERLFENNLSVYVNETLPETYSKLASRDPKAYEGAWQLWMEGIASGVMAPQFHGREHLNIKVMEEKLRNHDRELLASLENRSYTSLSDSGYSTIAYTAAFDFWDFSETDRFGEIIRNGLDAFEKVYGYRSIHFNAPGAPAHSVINQTLFDCGIRFLDSPLVHNEHQGRGKYRRSINWTGKKNTLDMYSLVRNAVFEPTEPRYSCWVNRCLSQIEAAFFLKRPAIISSHRVNFCGHIDKKNRTKGLADLKSLLEGIVERWPDVEFISSADLGRLIETG